MGLPRTIVAWTSRRIAPPRGAGRPAGKRGRKLADRRVKVERPHAPYFRYADEGQLVAREAASAPRTRAGRQLAKVRSVLFGRPLSIHEEIGERLSKVKALAIFSSDAISSSAYATEEILRVLVLAGVAAMATSIEVSIAIAGLLAIVALSYRQVCRAFPNGGGAYAVARSELTPLLGLVAAAALLIDYVMTVAVSTSSALDQLASLVPAAGDYKVLIAATVIALMTVANLRGLRESGNIFAVPTYVFVVLALGIVGIGLFNIVTGAAHPLAPQPNAESFGLEPLALLLVLKAFASGSVALTGVEAIANGVPAFKRPEAKNAGNTMMAMAVLLGVIFIGVSVVALAYAIVPSIGGYPSVVSLVAGAVYGQGSVLHGLFLVSTMLILFLAANTSYNAFPRLAALLAIDGYMPRQFSFRGDRLAYSWGIVLLAGVAVLLVAAFGGTTTLLIPLYAVGVFVCFSLSQTGHGSALAPRQGSGVAAYASRSTASAPLLTTVVLAIVVYEKFFGGAYLVVILIPILVGDDAVHPPPVPRLGEAARDRPGRRDPGAATRRPDRRPGGGHRSGRRPGGQPRPLDRPGCARGRHRGPARRRARPSRGVGSTLRRRPARHRGVAVSSPRRPDAGVPGLAGRGVALGG